MVWPAAKRVLPVPGLPESETLHFRPVVTHRRIAVHVSSKVEVHKLLHVHPDDLICTSGAGRGHGLTALLTGIDEDDLVEVHWEQDIEEEDLVAVVSVHT